MTDRNFGRLTGPKRLTNTKTFRLASRLVSLLQARSSGKLDLGELEEKDVEELTARLFGGIGCTGQRNDGIAASCVLRAADRTGTRPSELNCMAPKEGMEL